MGSSSTQPSSDALQPRTKAASPDIWQTSAPSPHASTVSLVSDETCAVVTHVGLQFTWYNCNDAHIFRQQYSTVGLMLIANFWATPHFCHETWTCCNVLLTLWFYFFSIIIIVLQRYPQVCLVTSCVIRWKSVCLSMRMASCLGRTWMSWKRQ